MSHHQPPGALARPGLPQAPLGFGRRAYAALAALVVASIVGTQIAFVGYDPDYLTASGVLFDDSFFYIKLAENYYKYGFLTLDGELRTNGVQPLWMWVQLAITKFTATTHGVTRIMMSSAFCFVAAVAVVTFRFFSSMPAARAVVATSIFGVMTFLNPNFQRWIVQGLESSLMLLVVAAAEMAIATIWPALAQSDSKSSLVRKSLFAALWLALSFFARTDLFVVSIAALAMLVATRGNSGRIAAVLIAAFLLAIIAPYLAWNFFEHGHLIPLSGRVKMFYLTSFYPNWTSYFSSNEWMGLFAAFVHAWGIPSAWPTLVTYPLIAAIYGCALFVAPRHLALCSVLHTLTMYVLYRELRPYTSYYFTLEVVVVAAAASWVLSRGLVTLARFWIARRLPLGTALIAALLVAVWSRHSIQPNRADTQRLYLSQIASRLIPKHERAAAFWPGIFSYYSQRDVVPLDGIIGSAEFFENVVQRGTQLSYLEERGIRFLFMYSPSHFPLSEKAEPVVADWSQLGYVALWKERHRIKNLLWSAPLSDSGLGWHLYELTLEPAGPA
jgi:hypothetical protein